MYPITGVHSNDELTDNLHLTFKENAMFLLDLASTSVGGRLTNDELFLKSGPWAIGEFKCLGNLGAKQQSDTDDAILFQLQDCSPLGVSIILTELQYILS